MPPAGYGAAPGYPQQGGPAAGPYAGPYYPPQPPPAPMYQQAAPPAPADQGGGCLKACLACTAVCFLCEMCGGGGGFF